jgi:hypothetical protein
MGQVIDAKKNPMILGGVLKRRMDLMLPMELEKQQQMDPKLAGYHQMDLMDEEKLLQNDSMVMDAVRIDECS